MPEFCPGNGPFHQQGIFAFRPSLLWGSWLFWSLWIGLGSAEERRAGPAHSSSCALRPRPWNARCSPLLLGLLQFQFMRCWFYVWPHVLKPHFANRSCHVKSRGQRSVKMGCNWEPFSEPRDRGARLFSLSLVPRRSWPGCAACSQDGWLTLQEFFTLLESPARERKLPCIWHPSGAHRGPWLSPILGGEGMLLFVTKLQMYLFPEVPMYSVGDGKYWVRIKFHSFLFSKSAL